MTAGGLEMPRAREDFTSSDIPSATWMRKFGGADTSALVATGVWKDRRSASRYEHVDIRDAARQADALPTKSRKTAG